MRSRYKPDWAKSWLVTNCAPDECEDSVMSMYDDIMDATYSSQTRVCIKMTERSSQEAAIARFLSTEELCRNSLNHCVPVLDVFLDPFDSTQQLLVMPYLRPFNNPAFGAVGEVIDFLEQMLEGLCFIHNHNVAHRDCAAANIMMDGRPLYPQDHHPIRLDSSLYWRTGAYPLSRLDHPVTYYFIDFVISSRFGEGESPYVVGTQGRDKAPELDKIIRYNAFMVDVWILGRAYDHEFLQKYVDLEFLQPLVSAMIVPQPERRVTAQEALRMFNEIRQKISDTQLRWRLRGRDESPSVRVVFDTIDVAKQGLHQLNRLLRRG